MTLQCLAIVALGANLGDRSVNLRQAIDRMQLFARGTLTCSSLYRTTPVDCPAEAPDFLNAVVAFEPGPGITPENLLTGLQRLEREFGRQPKRVVNEARPLDLDLIAFGRETRQTARLTLPHPRAHQRRFVLVPLAEILPAYRLPGSSSTIRDLLEKLKPGELVERFNG